ncbi:hypothetical protein ABT160_05865 [Streptomyces sp. NPDC001941]|uniref:hypothetical protein n=1 Tax=Streptomyces sp. NPDC001941 TaxID=3154659 RepID=UPI00332C7A6D
MLTEGCVALAAAGGTAVVQAAGTDAWSALRGRCAALLGRGDADGEQRARARLDATAQALAHRAGDGGDALDEEHRLLWQRVFTALLTSTASTDEAEGVHGELRSLVAEFGTSVPPASSCTVQGNTFHGPTAYQVGDHNRQDVHFGSTP